MFPECLTIHKQFFPKCLTIYKRFFPSVLLWLFRHDSVLWWYLTSLYPRSLPRLLSTILSSIFYLRLLIICNFQDILGSLTAISSLVIGMTPYSQFVLWYQPWLFICYFVPSYLPWILSISLFTGICCCSLFLMSFLSLTIHLYPRC